MGVKWYHLAIFCAVILAAALMSQPGSREQGIILSRAKRYEKAEPHLEKIHRIGPEDRSVLVELAKTYENTDQEAKSAALLQDYLQRHPADIEIRRELLDNLLRQYRLDEAIAALEGRRVPRVFREELYSLYLQAGYLDKAVALRKRELEEDREDLEGWLDVARLQRWRNDLDGLAAALAEIVRIEPTPEVLMEQLRLHDWRGDEARALDLADRLAGMEGLGLTDLRAIRTVYIRARRAETALRVAGRITATQDASVQDWLDLATLRVWTNDRAGALAALENGLERYPRSLALLEQAAWQAVQLGRPEVQAEYQLRIARLTDREEHWRQAAQVHAQIGRIGEARRMLEGATRTGEAAPRTLWTLGDLAAREDDERAALVYARELYAKLIEQTEVDIEILADAAGLLRRLGQGEAEIALLEKALGARGNESRLLLDLAAAYSEAGLPEKGLQVLARVRTLDGVDKVELRRTEAYLWLALLDGAEEGELPSSRLAVAQAIEATLVDAWSEDLAQALAETYLALGEAHKAVQWIEKLPTVTPDLRLALAEGLLALDDQNGARSALEAVETEALSADQLSQAAYLYGQLGATETALALLERADRKAGGQDKEIRMALADAYGAVGRIEKQYELMDALAQGGGPEDWGAAADRRLWNGDREGEATVLARGMARFPGDVRLSARRINALAALYRFDEAERLKPALRIDRPDPSFQTLFLVGNAYLALRDYALAKAYLLQAHALVPEEDEPVLQLARAEVGLIERKAALARYRQYLARRGDDPFAWFELGEVRYDAGLGGFAAQQRTLELMPTPRKPDELAVHARIRVRRGDIARAVGYYRRAIGRQSRNLDWPVDLGELYLAADMLPEAHAQVVRVRERNASWERARRLQAAVDLRAERPAQAVEILRELREKQPREPDVQADLAFAEDAADRPLGAMKEMRKALEKLEASAP